MTTLDDVMAEAIRLTRNATNEDTLRMIAAIEAYGDTRAADEREAIVTFIAGVDLTGLKDDYAWLICIADLLNALNAAIRARGKE